MTERTKNHLTLAGIVTGATLVVTTFGAMVNGIVSLDHKVGVGVSVTDSLFYNDSVQSLRLERVERALGIKGRKRMVAKPEHAGLVRRVWRMLF